MKPLIPLSVGELREKLSAHGVPLEQFGKGSAKTVEDLFQELKDREADLAVDEDGKVVRRTSVLAPDVCVGDARLYEWKQILKDGRERSRKLEATAGEKMAVGETREGALARFFEEEMPFAQGSAVTFGNVVLKRKESESYPGIETVYTFYRCTVEILPDNMPALAVKEQGGKWAYYKFCPR